MLTTSAVYLELLEDLDPDLARRVVRTADAVLDSLLRSWSAGRLPVADLYDYLADAVALLFGALGPDGGGQTRTPLSADGRRVPVVDGGSNV